jgi:hypothetical protein
MQTSGKSAVSDLGLAVAQQPDASLTRRCSSGNPACPEVLRLIHFTLFTTPSTMPLQKAQAASIGNRLRIVSQPINKSDELGNPTGPHSGFPLL